MKERRKEVKEELFSGQSAVETSNPGGNSRSNIALE
jgi:hypothetical protein